ncbi:MAG: hypothetical protein JO170_21920 [Verrucomicrobia bacterium]|nr:hypothetical protein [Verrucomicrobiota bacterium]
MSIEDIQKLRDHHPFRPFAIETNGGTEIRVSTPGQIAISPARTDLVIVFDDSGGYWFLDPVQISALYAH